MNIWVATKNAHKVEEISEILAPMKVKSFLDIQDCGQVDECGNTYKENAEIKARALYNIVKEPVIADDSGLEVDALNGEPGVNSSRYSGEDGNHQRNIEKLLKELQQEPTENRTARFKCSIVYIDKAGKSHDFEGVLEGYITQKLFGNGGFGYDPVFFLPDKKCTIAQLGDKEKNVISHRARAIEKLKCYLKENHLS